MNKFFFELQPGDQVWLQGQIREVLKVSTKDGFTSLKLSDGGATIRGSHDQIKAF